MGYEKEQRLTKVRKLFTGCHVDKSRNALAAWNYCGKEETRVEGPLEHGIPPAARNVKGDTKERNQLILKYGIAKAIEDGLIHIERAAQV